MKYQICNLCTNSKRPLDAFLPKKQYAKTRSISFPHFVSKRACYLFFDDILFIALTETIYKNALAVVFRNCFQRPRGANSGSRNMIQKRAWFGFPILFPGAAVAIHWWLVQFLVFGTRKLYCFWGCTFVDILVMFGAGYQSVVAFLNEVKTPKGQLVNRFGGLGGASANSPLLILGSSRIFRGRPRRPRKRSHGPQDKHWEPCACFPDYGRRQANSLK